MIAPIKPIDLPDLSNRRAEWLTPDDMAIRIFDGMFDPPKPESNWGLEGIVQPAWIRDVHNTLTGRTFLFGTGPSLRAQLPLLRHMRAEQTWTVNRMRQWDNLPFKPFHHVVAEPGPIAAFGAVIAPLYDYPVALNRVAVNWWKVTAPGWLWVPKAPDDVQMRWDGFYGLGDTLPPLPTGWASPLTVAQLAAWMGFTEFYFLGIDTTQVGQAWDVEQGRTAKPRNIRSILECFDRARRDIQRAGRKVYDCTPGGRINQEGALEYRDLWEVLTEAGHGEGCCKDVVL